MKKYDLLENRLLIKIYFIQEKWVPYFVCGSFYTVMSTTQRRANMNKFFKDYVNSSTPMSTFVVQYEKAPDAR